MLKIYWIGLILLFTFQSLAQIGGVSGDKLIAFNAKGIAPLALEFEPTLSYTRNDGFYNTQGDFQSISNVIRSTQMVFRSALGITENWEIGGQFDTGFSFFNLSTKYYLLGSERIDIGLMAGLNGTLGNDQVSPENLNDQYLFGLIAEYAFTENISLNINLTVQDQKDYNKSDFFFAADLGYYFQPGHMLIAAFTNQNYSNNLLLPSSKWQFLPGYIIERKNYVLVFTGQFDMSGKNIAAANGLSVTITQLIL